MTGETVVGLAILAALSGFVAAGWLALRSEWSASPGDRLVEVLATHKPSCRACNAAGRRGHPHAA